jgi:hypothetical protein
MFACRRLSQRHLTLDGCHRWRSRPQVQLFRVSMVGMLSPVFSATRAERMLVSSAGVNAALSGAIAEAARFWSDALAMALSVSGPERWPTSESVANITMTTTVVTAKPIRLEIVDIPPLVRSSFSAALRIPAIDFTVGPDIGFHGRHARPGRHGLRSCHPIAPV